MFEAPARHLTVMMNTKVKVAAIVLFVLANTAFVFWLRGRRPAAPAYMQKLIPLAEATPEEREQRVASAFALDGFDIQPLETESEFVTIPRPVAWREELIVSTKYVNAGPSEDGDHGTAKDSKADDSQLPWRAGAIKGNLTSITVAAYETVEVPDTGQVVIKEKLISRDACLTKSGIQVPVLQLFAVGRYYMDDEADTLLEIQRVIQINGVARAVWVSDVPHWLVPRKIAIGETWEQVGAHLRGRPDTGPRPKVVGTVNRVVTFEGRPAAEISSTSTFYDFSPGPKATPLKRVEKQLMYLDLETGEPLWYESTDNDDPEFKSVVRGCNQQFTSHLIPTPMPNK